MNKAFINKCSFYALWGIFLLSMAAVGEAHAGATVETVAENIVTQSFRLPALVSTSAYILGLILGVSAIFKLKEHVDNPSQVPLRTPLIRLLGGGALFALPVIYRAMFVTINAAPTNIVYNGGTWASYFSRISATFATFVPTMDFNAVLVNIGQGIDGLPGFLSAIAYLLAIVMGVAAILKIKDHVENPDQTPLREGVIRLLAGGALFALPIIYQALTNTIGGAGLLNGVMAVFGSAGLLSDTYTRTTCATSVGGANLGSVFCNMVFRSGVFPAFMTGLGYMVGLVLGVSGILKIKAHVLDPSRTQIWEGLARFLAAACFLSLPAIISIVTNTVAPTTLAVVGVVNPNTHFTAPSTVPTCGTGAAGGLSTVVYCMMNTTFAPLHIVLNFFAYCAGMVLIFIGVSRLIKSTQEGPKGPGGFGTIMTFTTGAALISYNALIVGATNTLFGGGIGVSSTKTAGSLAYVTGMTTAEQDTAIIAITTIIKLMIIVGLISFVRGLFIIRGVAEGNSQSSLMAGITHMVGGALAVNLGPLINAIQTTLGITAYGINFI